MQEIKETEVKPPEDIVEEKEVVEEKPIVKTEEPEAAELCPWNLAQWCQPDCKAYTAEGDCIRVETHFSTVSLISDIVFALKELLKKFTGIELPAEPVENEEEEA